MSEKSFVPPFPKRNVRCTRCENPHDYEELYNGYCLPCLWHNWKFQENRNRVLRRQIFLLQHRLKMDKTKTRRA